MTSERWTVTQTRAAEKDLDCLRGLRKQATREILKLEYNPYLGEPKHGSLKGVRALAFTMPGGAYRAAYIVDRRNRECLVFMVGPHENFYREAERRYKALRKQGRA
jgi:mRNA-degrading endonuclease RelE of RelBE toxin-antitoxin system